MAQSNAQRDPSMEEILASIRRIIEEGEEVRQKPADFRDDFEPTPIGPAANDAMRRPLAPAPELRRDVPAVEAVEPESFAPHHAQPRITDEVRPEPTIDELSLSLEDFVIDIDEVRQVATPDSVEMVDDLEAAIQQLDSQPLIEAEKPQTAQASIPQSGRIEPEFKQSEPAAVATPERTDVVLKAPDSAPSEKPVVAAPKITVTQIGVPNAPSVNPATIAPAAQAEPKPSMLSHAAERQVAASFTELSEALAASRRRPLDQIAEEMMRPMLQDWLDNNLPTLVERLVREEIERVARGAD